MSAVAITEQTDGATNEILLLDGAQDADVNDVLSVTNLRYQVDGLSGVAVTLDDDSKHNTELHVFAVVSGTPNTYIDLGSATVATDALSLTNVNVPAGATIAVYDADTVDAGAPSGNLITTTADPVVTAVTVTTLAGFTLAEDATTGSLNVDATDASFDALAAGATKVVKVLYDVTDNASSNPLTVARDVTVTITGTNDIPIISDTTPTGQAADEAGSGVAIDPLAGVTIADADSGDTHTVTHIISIDTNKAAGTQVALDSIQSVDLPAGVTYASSTGFTLDPADAAYNTLREGNC